MKKGPKENVFLFRLKSAFQPHSVETKNLLCVDLSKSAPQLFSLIFQLLRDFAGKVARS